MKKILIAFLLFISISSTSSALTVSHRYAIPGTDYTIELPWFFRVTSTNMTEYDPVVYEWGIDYEEALSIISNSEYDLVATTDSSIGINLFISVTQYAEDVGFSTQELSDDSLESFADDLAFEYYNSHPDNTSLIEDDLGSVYKSDHVNFVSFGYASEESESGLSGLSEHYIVIENKYMINMVIDYATNDLSVLMQATDISEDILNSVRKDYMLFM